jgi:hypothetical protein
MVGLEGWAVKSTGAHGDLVPLAKRPSEVPENALDSVVVELWSSDGDRLLDRSTSRIGYFSAGYIGPYQPGLEYLVKVSAPGCVPISKKIRLQKGKVLWARIELVSKAKKESTP